MIQPTPQRPVNISQLENQSQLQNQSQQHSRPHCGSANQANPPPVNPNCNAPQSAPPLAELSQPATKKNRKKRRLEPEDEDNPRYPQPLEELLKQTTVQLAKVAQDNSKGAFSAADEEFFLKLYQEQQQMLVIKAIERCVSLTMVHNFLGRRIAIREANKWNRFLQTDQARAIFQKSGLGIKHQSVMRELSEAYSKLTPEEKANLVNPSTPTDESILVDDLVNCPDQLPAPNPRPNCTHTTHNLTPEELVVDDPCNETDPVGAPKQPAATGNVSGLVQGTVSNIHSEVKAQKALDKWLGEAVHVAQTCNCEIVFFAVSRHLSKYSFKIERWTPGAEEACQTLGDLDGNHHYSARLQALITGNTVNNLTITRRFPGIKNQSLKALLPQLTNQLAQLLARGTKNVLTTWPWTDTDTKLKEAKCRVLLSSEAISDIEWIKTPNQHIKKTAVSMLLADLKDGNIKIVPLSADKLSSNDNGQSASPISKSGSTASLTIDGGGNDQEPNTNTNDHDVDQAGGVHG